MYNKKILILSLVFLAVISVIGIITLDNGTARMPEQKTTSTPVRKDTTIKLVAEHVPNLDAYGLDDDGMHIISGKIKRNQNLANLLGQYDVNSRTVYELTKSAHGVFNVRSIRPGHAFRLYLRDDSVQTVKHLVYEENPIDYVVFDLTKPYHVYTGRRKVAEVTNEATGVIESSLYLTLSQNNIDPALAEKLADVFAWQIDFYHLQKGDQFKILYTRKMIDGNPIGIGTIKAAIFVQDGHPYYAFRFKQNDKYDYFDLNGNSLRKAFLKAPLKYKYISSRFSYHRYHPVLHRYMPHLGVDFAAPRGTPVHSVGDGVIEVSKYSRYDGNYIKIRHNSEYQTEYLHLNHFARGIHPGVHVYPGPADRLRGQHGFSHRAAS